MSSSNPKVLNCLHALDIFRFLLISKLHQNGEFYMFKIQLQLVVWQTENKRMPNVFCSFVILLIPGFIQKSKEMKGYLFIQYLIYMSDIKYESRLKPNLFNKCGSNSIQYLYSS